MKMSELRGIIEEATREINYLQSYPVTECSQPSPPPSTASMSCGSGPGSTMPSPAEVDKCSAVYYTGLVKGQNPVIIDLTLLQQPNCVATAIELGLLTKETAEKYYTLFLENLRAFIPIAVDPSCSLTELCETEPFLALCMILAGFSTSQPNSVECLVSFTERILSERLIIMAENARAEMIKGLLLLMTFLQPNTERTVVMYMLMAINVAAAMNLGSEQEIKALNNPDTPPERRKAAHDRVTLFLTLYACVAAMTVNSSKLHLLKMLPASSAASDAILASGSGDGIPRFLTFAIRMFLLGQEGADTLTKYIADGQSFGVVKRTVVMFKERLDSLYNSAQTVLQGPSHVTLIRGGLQRQHVLLDELAIRYLVNKKRDDVEQIALGAYAHEVIRRCQDMISEYGTVLRACNIPKYVCCNIISGIMALIRLKLVLRGEGMSISVDIDQEFARIKEYWQNALDSNYTAKKFYHILLKLEDWYHVRIQGPLETQGKEKLTTLQLMEQLLADFALADTSPTQLPGSNSSPSSVSTACSALSLELQQQQQQQVPVMLPDPILPKQEQFDPLTLQTIPSAAATTTATGELITDGFGSIAAVPLPDGQTSGVPMQNGFPTYQVGLLLDDLFAELA
ncbi:hypothetical protein TRVA0_060S00122 [Trichomonascus vanleenenianus]|uniref:uncharacterized protein n=1 Tax=Trichomonascus vanleenenianus TaxID=2268995 RepID=UPI003EC9F38C